MIVVHRERTFPANQTAKMISLASQPYRQLVQVKKRVLVHWLEIEEIRPNRSRWNAPVVVQLRKIKRLVRTPYTECLRNENDIFDEMKLIGFGFV